MSGQPVDAEGRMIPDASWPPGRGAPGRLELARRFLNTTNRENGADHLGEPIRAARWLAGEGWAAHPSAAELLELRRFRDELYELVRQRWEAAWPSAVDRVRLGVRRDADDVRLVGAEAGHRDNQSRAASATSSAGAFRRVHSGSEFKNALP